MTKEQLIAKILEYSTIYYTINNIYKVANEDGSWNLEELNKRWNIELHNIWKNVKLAKSERDEKETELLNK